MLWFHCIMKIWPFICENTQKYDEYEDFFVSGLVDHLADLPICIINGEDHIEWRLPYSYTHSKYLLGQLALRWIFWRSELQDSRPYQRNSYRLYPPLVTGYCFLSLSFCHSRSLCIRFYKKCPIGRTCTLYMYICM